jgi:hypothetical protein
LLKGKPGDIKRKRQSRLMTNRKAERCQKQGVRERDRFVCRFPLCGCDRTGYALECSHDVHKGAGGDPTGERSTMDAMILLCAWRHKEAPISRDRKTLRCLPRTNAGNNGPVRWLLERDAFDDLMTEAGIHYPANLSYEPDYKGRLWVKIAREMAVQELAPLEEWQRQVLDYMGRMDI